MSLFDSIGSAISTLATSAENKIAESFTKLTSTVSGTSNITQLSAASASRISAIGNGLLTPGSPAASAAADSTTGAVSASTVNASIGVNTTSMHLVTLTSNDTPFDASSERTQVVFNVMPQLVEAHQVEYEAVAPSQFPGAFQKYKGTASVVWTLNATFIARTSDEAELNKQYLDTLRGWTEGYFGGYTGRDYPGYLGAPPPVLDLFGFRGLIGTVPVVITSLNWDWPKDVDWLPTLTKSEYDDNYVPFPAVLNVAINMVESYSINQFNSFSLADYRAGNMSEAFADTTSGGAIGGNTSPTEGSASTSDTTTANGGFVDAASSAGTTGANDTASASDTAIAAQAKAQEQEAAARDDAVTLKAQLAPIITPPQAAQLDSKIAGYQKLIDQRTENITALQAGDPLPHPDLPT